MFRVLTITLELSTSSSKVSDLPLAPKFHHENGRRYHPDAETKYPVPNDKVGALSAYYGET